MIPFIKSVGTFLVYKKTLRFTMATPVFTTMSLFYGVFLYSLDLHDALRRLFLPQIWTARSGVFPVPIFASWNLERIQKDNYRSSGGHCQSSAKIVMERVVSLLVGTFSYIDTWCNNSFTALLPRQRVPQVEVVCWSFSSLVVSIWGWGMGEKILFQCSFQGVCTVPSLILKMFNDNLWPDLQGRIRLPVLQW